MLEFVPILILLLAALAIILLQRFRPSLGYSWVIGSLAALAASGIMVFLRWKLPLQVAIANWLPFTQFTDSPIFSLDGSSWPYAFGLTVIILVMLLTASARLSYRINPWAWVSGLLVASAGLLATYAANLLTLALAWTLVDLIELIILSAYSENRNLGVQTVIAFSIRVTGMLLVILAALINRSQGIPPTFGGLPALSALFLLLAAGLRLGVLPINLPALPDMRVRRGLGTVMRLTSAASSLVVLARLPALTFSPVLVGILLAVTSLAVLYAAAMWLVAADEIAGRPYWLIALAGMAMVCVIRGDPRASLSWGMALILAGALIFLYSARTRGTLLIPLAGLLGLSALPFTPAAGGWPGILSGQFTLWQVLLLLAHVFLLLGYLRFAVRPGDKLGDMERWVQVTYPFGLILLVAAQWFAGTLGWPGALTLGVWWAAPVTGLGLIVGGLGLLLYRRVEQAAPASLRWYLVSVRKIGASLSTLFSLGWLYTLLWAIYRRLEQLVHLLTDILEGDGGLLWVFVLLALFVSLVRSRVTP